MSNVKHINDMIIAQRKLLWPLSPVERAHKIAEIRADYEYEAQLSAVAEAMSDEEAEAEAQDARGAMIVIVIAEATVVIAAVTAAVLWSGIWSSAI